MPDSRPTQWLLISGPVEGSLLHTCCLLRAPRSCYALGSLTAGWPPPRTAARRHAPLILSVCPPEYLPNSLTTAWHASRLILPPSTTPLLSSQATGCVMAEMATGQPLFPGKTDLDQLCVINRMNTRANHKAWCDGRMSDLGLELLAGFLDPNPKTRITAAEAQKHPYLASSCDGPPRCCRAHAAHTPRTRRSFLCCAALRRRMPFLLAIVHSDPVTHALPSCTPLYIACLSFSRCGNLVASRGLQNVRNAPRL